ncbi:unnamed protein product [Cylindrotheca closterium]|uniref:Uncharacterized protein n=1 Tax=Cylindrotheca closterium TaxID=2856 RepID=A0AAD2CJK7_9STRA|nr:unnamed protein product [Cylindrotheca closterium]
MPDEALDFGTTVMVMQITCKAPGCVPLETAIIIVFPQSPEELIPDLPESKDGGSYKTKILKPMAEVTKDDVLDSLPSQFTGGRRTMEKLCIGARDVMLAQITQLFGEESDSTVGDRKAMAEYMQLCLQQYIDNGCKPPPLGVPVAMIPSKAQKGGVTIDAQTDTKETGKAPIGAKSAGGAEEEVQEEMANLSASSTTTTTVTSARASAVRHSNRVNNSINPTRSISNLFNREHAPGIRQPGCPCCDPDNPNGIMGQMLNI